LERKDFERPFHAVKERSVASRYSQVASESTEPPRLADSYESSRPAMVTSNMFISSQVVNQSKIIQTADQIALLLG